MKLAGVKLSNARLVKSGTIQGLVEGRDTSGAAVTGFDEPIWGVLGAITTCARAKLAGRAVSTTAEARKRDAFLSIFWGFLKKGFMLREQN